MHKKALRSKHQLWDRKQTSFREEKIGWRLEEDKIR